jgi:hypothetical protein
VSLLLVAAVGVSASSGKFGLSGTLKQSVVTLFSGPSAALHGENGKGDDQCKPNKGFHGHHHHATGDRENDACEGDD